MQVTIYLDIIFFINFLTDLFALYLTGKVMKQRIAVWRLVSGALFGAGALLPFLTVPSLLYGKTGVIICMGINMGAVSISLGRKNGGIIKKWFLSTTIMILLGGVMNCLRYKIGISTITFFVWFCMFLGSAVICIVLIRFWKWRLHKQNAIYSVEIRNGRQLLTAKFFLDTGNMLLDSLYGKPVMILSEEAVKECLEEEERRFIEQYNISGQMDFEKMLVCNLLRKDSFHEIAYQSVGSPTGKLLCFLADEVQIEGSERILKRQPIAIASSVLFRGKEYEGLLHSECI